MLITFTTEEGQLVIRAEDLRWIEDRPNYNTLDPDQPYSLLTWLSHDTTQHRIVLGTATDNASRIVAEEAKLIAAYEAAQRIAQPKARKAVNR